MPSPLMPRVVLLILIHGARMAPGAKLFFLWGMDTREGGMGYFCFAPRGGLREKWYLDPPSRKEASSLSVPVQAGRISPFSFHSIRHCGSTAAIATMYYSAHWIPLPLLPRPPRRHIGVASSSVTPPFPSTHVFVTINDIGDGKEGRSGDGGGSGTAH